MSETRYALVKVEHSTGAVVAVAARSMLFHHADRIAADLNRVVQDGHYFKAETDTATDQQAKGNTP